MVKMTDEKYPVKVPLLLNLRVPFIAFSQKWKTGKLQRFSETNDLQSLNQ